MVATVTSAVSLACNTRANDDGPAAVDDDVSLAPRVVTEPVKHDTDDPAIWIHPSDPSESLVIGTDKDEDGALFVYDLLGRTLRVVSGLQRPNNVDVAYRLMVDSVPTDVVVATERYTSKLRVFRLPDMTAIDNGAIDLFDGEELRAAMGVALYTRPTDDALFAIVSRKEGPSDDYLWQYRLADDGTGKVKGTLVRTFGAFSGKEEIEAIAVDNALGYVYYSDETFGVRKYHADPDAPNADEEIAVFAQDGFQGDHEGISIYEVDDGTGYIIVSDQQDVNEFHIYPREGSPDNPHDHPLLKVVKTQTVDSDGSAVTSAALNETFSDGLFVAMSGDRTFHFYSWADFAGDDLRVASKGVRVDGE